jgi:hypothetical protein
MTEDELTILARDWIRYYRAEKGSPEREAAAWATDLYELECHDPESLWLPILAIHAKDQSPCIQQGLSAGPVEELLAKHGENFIERMEIEARRDPMFAKLLGGVWKNSMRDDVWRRLQTVWDRRGWGGNLK